MKKIIDLSKSVYELSCEHSDFVDIMKELGFAEISKKVMLHSVGKLVTIPKGAQMKNIPLEKIVTTFANHGYEIEGVDLSQMQKSSVSKMSDVAMHRVVQSKANGSLSRLDQIKSYLLRLNEGESLESVQADFVKHFSNVKASEIMSAEQELLKDGVPLEDVQKLCDVHSALFHDTLRKTDSYIVASDVAFTDQHQHIDTSLNANQPKMSISKSHFLNTLKAENVEIKKLIDKIRSKLANDENIDDDIAKLRAVSTHYAKKGDLLYPLLKVKYGVSGPSDVMWTVDDEIRNSLSLYVQDNAVSRLNDVLDRMEEMVYKEENILFPICLEHFSLDEWYQIYHDSKDYAMCFDVEQTLWSDAEQFELKSLHDASDGKINMPGGHLTVEQLSAMLNTMPIEITFVDADNINCYFNEGPKVFKRPSMAIDRNVFSCHPPKIEVMVRQIIDDFRSGQRDSFVVWMEKENKPYCVTYMAVRNAQGKYVGTVELVQNMEFARQHFLSEQ